LILDEDEEEENEYLEKLAQWKKGIYIQFVIVLFVPYYVFFS